jgi:putative tricarboxylic transport membrane protein
MKSSAFEKGARSLVAPVLIFALAFYFYVLAGKIEEVPIPGQLGPAFWPKIMLILLMISCGIKALEIILEQRREAAEVERQTLAQAVDIPKLAAMIASIVGVVYAMEVLGFLLANFLFLMIFMKIAGWRKKVSLFIAPLMGTVCLLYLFVKVVYLPLPKGQWYFYDLTIFLYRLLRIF